MQQHVFDAVVRQRGAAQKQAAKSLPVRQRRIDHYQIQFSQGSQAPLERKTLLPPSRPFSQSTRLRKRSTNMDMLSDDGVVGLGIIQSDSDDNTVKSREGEDVHGSPRTQMLIQQLQDVNEALEQLKDQVMTSRTRRWSRSLNQELPPAVQASAERRAKGTSRRAPHLRRHIPQVRFDCGGEHDGSPHKEARPTSTLHPHTSPAGQRTESPRFSSQRYMPSPTMASSVDSTPRILATPTFGSSAQWTAPSPTVSSASAFQTRASTNTSSAAHATSSSQGHGATASAQTATSTGGVVQVPLQNAQSQSSSQASDTTAQHSQSDVHDRHVAVASGIAGGVAGSLLVLLLLMWAFLACRRKRQRRRSELNSALEKVAPSPSLPPRSIRSGGGNSVSTEPLATGSAPGSVPTFTTSFLGAPGPTSPLFLQAPHDPIETDLEANQRHSHELVQSGAISGYNGHVNRDLSFTWMFPKLSVPPAAARALTTGHYVKKRSLQPEAPPSASMQSLTTSASQVNMTMSMSMVTSLQSGSAAGSSVGAPATTPGENPASSAAASSELVDPQVNHDQRSFLPPKNSVSRMQWWGSALRGQSQDVQADQTVSTMSSARSSKNWFTSATDSSSGNGTRNNSAEKSRRISHVLAAHDPKMQSVVEKILFMSEDEQEMYRQSAVSVETEYNEQQATESPTPHSRRASSTSSTVLRRTSTSSVSLAPSARTGAANRRASGVSVRTTLETCNEESHDSQTLPTSHDYSSATSERTVQATSANLGSRMVAESYSQSRDIAGNVMMDDDNDGDEATDYLEAIFGDTSDDTVTMPQASPVPSRTSQAYSNHSIVIHSGSTDMANEEGEDSADEDSAESLAHSIPAVPDPRRRTSLTPRIMLTTSEEDGRHERHISVTSVDSTVRSISSGSLDDGTDGGGAGNVSIDRSSIASSSSSGSDHSLYPDATYADIATSIGQAFVEQEHDEHRASLDQTRARASLNKARLLRDSDSTIDSLVAYTHGAREGDADAMVHYYDDLDEGDPHRNVAFDDAYMEAAEALYDFTTLTKTSSGHSQSVHTAASRHSYTPSETGTACLLDDDFPTIPAWKPVPNNSPWRSTSFAQVI